jgi:hypothetical protein
LVFKIDFNQVIDKKIKIKKFFRELFFKLEDWFSSGNGFSGLLGVSRKLFLKFFEAVSR